MIKVSQGTVNTIRRDLFDKMQDLPISYFDTHTHGDLMSRYTNDVDTVRNFLSNGFVQVISSVISVIATFAMMLYLSWQLTLLVILMLIIMLIVIKVIGGKSALYFKKQQKDLGAANGYIEETIEGQKVIKGIQSRGKCQGGVCRTLTVRLSIPLPTPIPLQVF